MSEPSNLTKKGLIAGAFFWALSLAILISSAACLRQQACGWEAMSTAYFLGAAMLLPAWLVASIVSGFVATESRKNKPD